MSNNEAEDSIATAFVTIVVIVVTVIVAIVGGLVWLVKHLF
jgi:flagellar basal body-associated protein FliL